jgi:hypothetical protein
MVAVDGTAVAGVGVAAVGDGAGLHSESVWVSDWPEQDIMAAGEIRTDTDILTVMRATEAGTADVMSCSAVCGLHTAGAFVQSRSAARAHEPDK